VATDKITVADETLMGVSRSDFKTGHEYHLSLMKMRLQKRTVMTFSMITALT
jgi:hypothetical protein